MVSIFGQMMSSDVFGIGTHRVEPLKAGNPIAEFLQLLREHHVLAGLHTRLREALPRLRDARPDSDDPEQFNRPGFQRNQHLRANLFSGLHRHSAAAELLQLLHLVHHLVPVHLVLQQDLADLPSR